MKNKITKEQLRKVIAGNIRERRIAADMKQRQLAEACGTRQAQISLLEHGKAQFDDGILAQLSEVFDVNPDELLRPLRPRPESAGS